MTKQIAKEADLTVKIISIIAKSKTQIRPSFSGIPVTQPIWRWDFSDSEIKDNGGSKKPAVFKITGPGWKGPLKVSVKVEGLKPGEKAELAGKLADMVFKGILKSIENSPGKKEVPPGATHTAEVYLLPEHKPKGFKWLRGDMEWHLILPAGNRVPVCNTTRLEFFWIYGEPGRMFLRGGVWVEALRLIGDICGREKTKDDIIKRVVNYCHSEAGLKYDSEFGSCYFVDGSYGGVFKLEAFLNKEIEICNCYDLAGAVQTLLGAVGIPVQWLYMQPFGFINKTSLIGQGTTNNPFFLMEHPLQIKDDRIVPENIFFRTSFGNHAFCGFKTPTGTSVRVLDACAGPYLGDKSRRRYLKEAIDGQTILYTQRFGKVRTSIVNKLRGRMQFRKLPQAQGSIQNIKTYAGILDVDTNCWSAQPVEIHDDERVRKFKAQINFGACGQGVKPGQGVVFNWSRGKSKLYELLQLDESWGVVSQTVRYSMDGGEKEWIFSRHEEWIRVNLFVSNKGIEEAKNRFISHAAHNTRDKIPFEKCPQGPGQLCVITKTAHTEKTIGVFYNVCFLVEIKNSSIDSRQILRSFPRQVESSIVDRLEDFLPKIEEITVSPPAKKIKIGEKVTVKITAAPDQKNLLLVFTFLGDSLICEYHDLYSSKSRESSLIFRGKKSGSTEIIPVLANYKNLLCSSASQIIKVGKTKLREQGF